MQIASLFQTLPKANKPTRRGTNEYDFSVNRAAGRVSDLRDLLTSSETIRIRAATPFSWCGSVELPDASTGVLRRITCNAVIEGILPGDSAALRDFLNLVLKDKFDFGRLFGRALDVAISKCGRDCEGRFVEQLRINPSSMHAALLSALRGERLHITRVALRPTYYDAANTRDLADDTPGLAIRTRDMLERNRVGYKARLVWGHELPHVVARLAYRGTIEGRDPDGPPAIRLVADQIQPVEAWFRQLLTEELGHETLEDILANTPAMLDRVKEAVSKRLGQSTGRIVESLVVHLLPGSTPLYTERALQFRERYAIAGIRGSDGLDVQHTIRYALADRDRWHAAGQTDPETLLRREVVEAMKLFLNEKRFEDVVGIYLDNDQAAKLSGEVERRVAPIGMVHGHRLVSTSMILAIPQHDFIDGREIRLAEDKYQLAEPHLEPQMSVTVTVRVVDGSKFANALARHEDFKARLQQAIEQTTRTVLRTRSALEYFGSPFVNGLPVATLPTGDPSSGVARTRIDSFTDAVYTALDGMLRDRFGLLLDSFDITPGEDKIITRMQELANRTIYFQPEPFVFPRGEIDMSVKRGEIDTSVKLAARATIFVTGLSERYWPSFQYSVQRFPIVEDHENEICRVLAEALRMLQHALVADGTKGRDGLLSGRLHEQVIAFFSDRMREHYGLEARLHPLTLLVIRPKVDQTSSMLIEALHEELQKLLVERNNLIDNTSTDAEYERERLTRRIEIVRSELESESARRETEISETEAVQVSQDLSTGLISQPQPALDGASQLSEVRSREISVLGPTSTTS